MSFDDLVADPVAEVERIYGHFGLEMDERYRERLRRAARAGAPSAFRSRFREELDSFGLRSG